jgi:sugar-specific transcriptional regulator TrmB
MIQFYGDVSLLKEDAVRKLTDFGLSVNQAKVYLSIVQCGPITVNQISTATNLHRQDVYKILPKLEKKGLTTKKIDKPVLVNAVSLKEALNSLVLIEKKKAIERANRQAIELKELVKELKKTHEETIEQDSSFVLISGNEAVTNKVIETSANSKKQHDAHFSEDFILRYPKHIWRKGFLLEAQNGVKQRLLIGTTGNRESVAKIIEETKPPKGFFTVKTTAKKLYDEYMTIDHKHAFVAIQKEPYLVALSTNNNIIVRILEENFETLWYDSRTEKLYEQS